MKKIPSRKSSYIFLYFGKRNFLALVLTNFLYFLKRKLFYISESKNRGKIPYILGNGTFLYLRKRITFYISGSKFPSSKNRKKNTLKKFLIIREIGLSSPKLKKLLIFQERTCKGRKSNKKLFFRTTNLLICIHESLVIFFSYKAFNSAPHHIYLTEFWTFFTS